MNNLRYVKLKDCCDVVGGSTPKRNVPEYWLNEIPWVTPKDISSLDCPFLNDAPEYISKKGYNSCSTYLLPKNSILLTTRAPIGNVAIAGREMCTNQGFKNLVPHDGVDFLYLYYCIKHHSPQLKALGNGATFKEISKKIVEDFEVPLPTIEEQKRIASILDKADAVRRKRRQAIELNKLLLHSVFLDMFGDPISNPNGWEKTTLENVCRKITDGTHHSPKSISKGIHYITAKHVKPNKIDFDSKPTYISLEDHNAIYSRCNPEINDVLYIKDGATTGIAAINPYGFEFSMLSSLALIKTNHMHLMPEYLCDWLNSQSIKDRILKNVSGVAITRLTLRKIKDIQIELPPIQLQKDYQKLRETIMDSQNKYYSSLNISEELFNSLIQRAFNSELSRQLEKELA